MGPKLCLRALEAGDAGLDSVASCPFSIAWALTERGGVAESGGAVHKLEPNWMGGTVTALALLLWWEQLVLKVRLVIGSWPHWSNITEH